jgi:ribosomal protein L16/L10AE
MRQKKLKVWFFQECFPIGQRQKKKGVRMGKGKGAVASWVVPVSAGMVLFEVFGLLEEKQIKQIFKNSAIRLSLKTKTLFF